MEPDLEDKGSSKALNLLWRALSCCLPTMVQPDHKHVQVEKKCPVCLRKDATILHGLVTSPFATQCSRIILPNDQGLDE